MCEYYQDALMQKEKYLQRQIVRISEKYMSNPY